MDSQEIIGIYLSHGQSRYYWYLFVTWTVKILWAFICHRVSQDIGVFVTWTVKILLAFICDMDSQDIISVYLSQEQ